MRIKNIFLFIIAFAAITINASAHWTTKGPYGGRVKCLLAADTLVFIGSEDGGVYRSTSSAVSTWRYANYDGLYNPEVLALAQIGPYILAGTSTGIFRSSNIGASWTMANTGLTTPHVLTLLHAGDRVLAGTMGGGVFLSHDSAATWTASNVGLTDLTVNDLAYDGANIYAATNNGVFVSTDEGDSWTAINTGLAPMNYTCIIYSGGNLFLGSVSGVFMTNATTINWTNASSGMGALPVYDLTAAGGNVYAATQTGLYTSSDVAGAWTGAGGYTGIATAVAVFNSKIYMGTQNDGVLRSNSLSGINFAPHNTGLNNLWSYDVYNDGLLVIVATNKGLFVSRDLAASYTPANNGLTDSTHVNAIIFAGTDLYVTTTAGGIFKSADTGATWAPVNAGLSTLSMDKIFATSSHLVACSTTGQVFTTPISSINWTLVSGLPTVFVQDITGEGSTHVFLATLSQGIYSTTDLVTWTNVNPGLAATDISSVVIKGTDIYAGTLGHGIYKSNVSTLSWSAVNTGLPTLEITALHASGTWVVAGYTGGVHATYDNGASWGPTNVMDYIPDFAYIFDISFSPASTRVFITAHTNSVYSNSTSELPVGINEIDLGASLFNISPNPGNGSFNILLKDMSESIESVLIMDMNGKTITSILPIKRSVSMQVSVELAKGVYLVKVTTSAGAHTQKLVIE